MYQQGEKALVDRNWGGGGKQDRSCVGRGEGRGGTIKCITVGTAWGTGIGPFREWVYSCNRKRKKKNIVSMIIEPQAKIYQMYDISIIRMPRHIDMSYILGAFYDDMFCIDDNLSYVMMSMIGIQFSERSSTLNRRHRFQSMGQPQYIL